MPLIRDISPLLLIHAAVLALTVILGDGNSADAVVQTCWLGFLLPGWCIAPLWQGKTSSMLSRYSGGMITAMAVYAAAIATFCALQLSMASMIRFWIVLLIASLAIRGFTLHGVEHAPWRIPKSHLIVIATLVVVSICIYEAPRSNDIHQFILQQQDMTRWETLQVSPIGMSAMEVDQPMPRWRAHYFHLLPCLISQSSGVAVDLVLQRYLTIPIAFSVLLCLVHFIRTLSLRRASYPVCMLASLSPVLFGFRNFNAFNYSFRITNNFLLDKDFALFWLIPAIATLTVQWARGRSRSIIPLLLLAPAVVRFHPLTAVYLLMLVPPCLLAFYRSKRFHMSRSIIAYGYLGILFITVLLLGDAQGNHDQIREVIVMDFQQSLSGRPLHYWVGFYNTIKDSGLPSDTLAYRGQTLSLQSSVITGCGLLLFMHAGFLMIAARDLARRYLLRKGPAKPQISPALILAASSLSILWLIWFASPFVLSRVPHISGGYERLHWFIYPAAITTLAIAIQSIIPPWLRRRSEWLLAALLVTPCLLYRYDIESPTSQIRGINSLLDFELAAATERRDRWQAVDPARSLSDLRPAELAEDDQVLLLELSATLHYWLVESGSYWPDCYVEAFAWDRRGESFLVDRQIFYHLLDRQPLDVQPSATQTLTIPTVSKWLAEKGITLIVDRRRGAAEYLNQLGFAPIDSDGTMFRKTLLGKTLTDPTEHAD